MKKLNILLFLMFVSVFAYSQWTYLNSGTTNALRSVYFIDVNTGYAVGRFGTIIKTTDGGITWSTQTSGISDYLESVYFTNANTGYAVGANVILKTTNGGTNWTAQIGWEGHTLSSVYFPDPNTGYVVGRFGTLLKTSDGGTNWTTQTIETTTYFLTSVYFTDSNTGYAVGGGYNPYPYYRDVILKTTNGGTNWEYQILGNTNPSYHLNSIFFPDAYTGYAVGGYYSSNSKIILKTTNGGEIWTTIISGTGYPLYSVYFTDTNTGYAVGGSTNALGFIQSTTNGGINWTTYTIGTYNALMSVHFPDANTGYVVGENGVILKTTNGGTVFVDENTITESLFLLFPNPSTGKVTLTNNGDLQKETVVNIYNIQGVEVLTNSFKYQNSMDFDVSSLAPGIYMVKIQNEKGFAVKRLVVQ